MKIPRLSLKLVRVDNFRGLASHTVFNQSKPYENVSMLESDPSMLVFLNKVQAKYTVDLPYLEKHGKLCGSVDLMRAADQAEKNKPVLVQFDTQGRRTDVIDYHPAYHTIMKHGLTQGSAGYGFKNQATHGAQIMRAAIIYMENQVEPGHCCPITMTAAAIPVLQRSTHSDWSKLLLDRILTCDYDPRNLPIQDKHAATIGMSMTEKQGGSDVRANTTMAIASDNNGYRLTGHKWFTSAPMCDAFLTLAQTSTTSTSPTCFLVPRFLPDGSRNTGFQIMRLKDKLGDRANASSEVEYHSAWGEILGEEGKGVKTIIEMVQATRLDCTLGSAGTMRKSLQVAINHAATRSAFGAHLLQQPLMLSLLADLAVEAEAATLTALYMSSIYDDCYNGSTSTPQQKQHAQELFRIAVTVAKYHVTKRLPQFTYECMEALGGNGYTEDWPMARLYRQAPLNAIWEGSGNVIALDLLRGIKAVPVLLADIKTVSGMSVALDQFIARLEKDLHTASKDPLGVQTQRMARNLADRLGLAMQASIMLRYGDADTAQLFLQLRITADGMYDGVNYGSGNISQVDEAVIKRVVERHMPVFY